MNILFSVHGYKPAWRIGGPAISVSSLAESLVARGHQVTVLTTNSNLDEDLPVPTDRFVNVDGVRVRYFRREEPLKRFLPHFKYASQSIGTLYTPDMSDVLASMSASVDVMHTHLPFVYPTLATARAAFRSKTPLFYHQRGVLDPERLRFRAIKKSIYLSLIEKPILRKATTLIALTDAERQSYSALGVTTPCRVIPNGINLPDLPRNPDHGFMKRQFGVLPQHQLVLFMGRLHPTKGVGLLIEAFIQVASGDPNCMLVVAGPDEFGSQPAFLNQVAKAGLAEQVKFPGMVSGLAKELLLQRADLMVLPSDAEGFSMSILEALAHETAVLISPRCFFPEVETAGAGKVVQPTVSELVKSLSELLAQPDRLIAMGRAGRKLVADRYSWHTITSQMLDAYEEGIERHRWEHLRF